MTKEKESKRRKTPGARAGKSPAKNVRSNLTQSKYASGGAKIRKKGGGYMRKPKPPIRYTHKKSDS